MSPWRTTLTGLSHRFAYAALVSALVWVGFQLPIPEGTFPPTEWGTRNSVVRWLDLPIAMTTQLLPCDEFAIDLWFTPQCPFNGGGPARLFANHMRLGIPTYMLIFYLPAIFRASRDWWLRQRQHRRPVAAKT